MSIITISYGRKPMLYLFTAPDPGFESLETIDLFSVSISFVFSRMSYDWNHTVYSLSDWLILPSNKYLRLVKFSSVAQSCPTLRDPMNCSTPGLPVHHQLLESTQIHVHTVGDAIQPSHSLSSPSPHALNLSQHQGLFK